MSIGTFQVWLNRAPTNTARVETAVSLSKIEIRSEN